MAAPKKKKSPAKKSGSVKTKSAAKPASKSVGAKAAKPSAKPKGKAKALPVKAKAPAKGKTPAKAKPKVAARAGAKSPSSSAKRSSEKPKSIGAKIKAAVLNTIEKSSELIERVIHPDTFKSLQPLEDRVVVQADSPETKTAGGLFVPGTSDEKPTRGRVMAVGKGKRSKKGILRPPDVKVGDHILFAGYLGQSITINGTEFLVLREEDVLGVSES